jgi:hypothetical protein
MKEMSEQPETRKLTLVASSWLWEFCLSKVTGVYQTPLRHGEDDVNSSRQ